MRYLRVAIPSIAAEIFAKFVLALSGLIVVRVLPVEQYAHYAVVVTVLSIVLQVLISTITTVWISQVGGHAWRATEADLLAFLGAVSVIGSAAIAIGSYFLGYPWLETGALFLLQALYFSNLARLQLRKRFRIYYTSEIIRALVFIVGITGYGYFTGPETLGNLPNVLLIQGTSFALGLVSVIKAVGFPTTKMGPLGIRIIWSGLREGGVLLLGRHNLSSSWLLNADILMLSWFLSSEREVAVYAVAVRFYSMLMLALTASNKVLLPTLRDLSESDRRGVLMQHHYIVLVYFVSLVAIWPAAAYLLPLLAGDIYEESVQIFKILSISAGISLALSVYSSLLILRGMTDKLELASRLGVLLQAILLPISIYYFGGVGAAVASLAIYAFVNGLTYKFAILVK